MGNGPRYKVQTRYGWFSLDEGSYRDYLSGKLQWIDWPPLKSKKQQDVQETLPPDVSKQAIQLREAAAKTSVPDVLLQFPNAPHAPYKDRMSDLDIYELNLSVRSSNGLMRAGIHTFGKLNTLMMSEGGILSIRNLGAKSVKEIRTAFIAECYSRLIPYEKAEFWQTVIDSNN